MRAIHQFVAGYTNGDAISNEVRLLRTMFRNWGFRSDVFCDPPHILPQLRQDAIDVAAYTTAAASDDVALLHLSIGSPVNDVFARLPCRKAILYHNVTPSFHFDAVNRRLALDLARGREQMMRLAGAAAVNMADSRFNAGELEAAGYRDVRVLPLILDLDGFGRDVDRGILKRFDDGRVNVLFVGRCAPNKKIEDGLRTFRLFQSCVEPFSRFIHVGSFAGTERYYSMLLTQAKRWELDAVHFAGSATQPQLNAFYRCASVFLCMSEHEGFCIPILESMAADVPVLAFAAAAVPETMDGAGILFSEKRHEAVAEMLGRVVRDAALRKAVLAGQRARVARYRSRDLAAELRGHLAPLIG